jgi:hypothetical protein
LKFAERLLFPNLNDSVERTTTRVFQLLFFSWQFLLQNLQGQNDLVLQD